jgi:hypothetical protein
VDVAVSGTLGLSSPWARQAIQGELRTELSALVPDRWGVGLSVAANHRSYRAWCTDMREEPPRYAVHIVEAHDAERAIRKAIAWIRAGVHA